MADNNKVLIDYTNHRGERSSRIIEPLGIYWGSTEYHPRSQWLLEATDITKGAFRIFAMKDIHSWTPSPA